MSYKTAVASGRGSLPHYLFFPAKHLCVCVNFAVFTGMITVEKAVNGNHLEFSVSIPNDFSFDFDLSISYLSDQLYELLKYEKKKLPKKYAFKFQLRLQAVLEKFSFENDKYISVDVWFTSDNHNVILASELRRKMRAAFSQLISRYDSFLQEGSGWVLMKVKKAIVVFMKYELFSGGCLGVSLPKLLQTKKACITVAQSEEEKCFLYAFVSALTGKVRNPQRPCKLYQKLLALLPIENLNFPTSLRDIKKFEKNSIASINIYGWDQQSPFPYYISPLKGKKYHVNLLLHKNHFFTIRNMGTFVSKTINRRRTFVCECCLSYFVSPKRYKLHLSLCKGDAQKFHIPYDQLNLKFQNMQYMFEAPFVLYCDLETIIQNPTHNEEKTKNKIISRRKHLPISIASKTVCRLDDSLNSPLFLYTGEDCIDVFLQYLKNEFERIQDILTYKNEPMIFTAEDESKYESMNVCRLCGLEFIDYLKCLKVRDHCHLTGKFRFALCSSCNFTYAKQKKDICVFFHGLSNYDSHFIIQKLYQFQEKDIKIIPRSSEKYLSFSIGNIKFKDTYQFLAESLAQLVINLRGKGDHCFKYVNMEFPERNQNVLLKQKGVFPYSYCNTVEVLNQPSLPKIEDFKNDLTNTNISNEDYLFAQKVWDEFHCKNMKDYLEIYLKADCLLLADVFENFRTKCISEHGLDPSYYYSAPHYSFDVFLKRSKITLELLSDINQYLFINNGIRGGLSMVSKRYSSANNKYLKHYDAGKTSTYIIDIDANNLYGKAMQEYLPYAHFEWYKATPELVFKILSTPPDSDVGFILQVDLTYPKKLHDLHADYPLCPEKRRIPYDELSQVAKSICDKHKIKSSTNAEKLLATLHDKHKYIIHYRNLQLYLKLGMILENVYAVLKFKQAPFIASYINFNSTERSKATNSFDIAFYKYMSNALFGKTIERPDKRTKIKLVSTPKSYKRCVSKLNFKHAKIINKNLVGIEMRYQSIKINKPFYIGMSVLELAKFFMYKFHYEVMKPFYGSKIQLLYTDTDSLMYEIQTEDVYQDLAKLKTFFDFSNYPSHHELFDETNKRVPGLFKDECASKVVEAFIGLRSKMYVFKVEDKEVKVAKGVKKNVIYQNLKFEDYKKALEEHVQYEHEFKTITSQKHDVQTMFQSKISLSAFDDKRFLIDKINSLPYGHYSLLSESCAEKV